MPEVICYGCVHLRYSGSASVKGKTDLMGGTAVPIRESDAHYMDPGRYRCAKLKETICGGDSKPRELEPGCKESR